MRLAWTLACALALTLGCGSSSNPESDGPVDGHPGMDAGSDGTPPPDTMAADDSDGDGIRDADEGAPGRDTDADGTPDYLDTDSDGDGVSDADEAGDTDLDTPPVDSDDDGKADVLELDSDGNGVVDGAETEDTDGDGTPDRIDLDDDGDGASDLLEWGAGTDPHDAADAPPAGAPYAVVGPGKLGSLDVTFGATIQMTDVVFETDTTGSMGGTISTLSNSLQTVIVPQLGLVIPNLAFGVTEFKDFPVAPFSGPPDMPYHLNARVTTVVADVQTGIDSYSASGGGDGPEAGMEGLYQTLTGEGISWTVTPPGEVAKFEALDGYDPAVNGVIGGVGFRDGALPVVVHTTDIEYHEATDYWGAGITEAHSRDQAVTAANGLGARFIGITSSVTARVNLEQISRDTGALVPPTTWGAGETFCHTGVGGSLRPPDPSGLCPLTFDMNWDGTGVDVQAVDGVKALVQAVLLDVTARAVGDPLALPVDTTAFVASTEPIDPLPAGATIDGAVLRGVTPGDTAAFRVHLTNNIVPSGAQPQIYVITIRGLSGLVHLEETTIFVIIPGGA